jgi:hypothetical protein
MKLEYFIGAGLVLLWLKGSRKKATDVQMADTIASQKGSDWIGVGGLYDAWDRLSGADLKLESYPNLHVGAQADPGKIGTLQSGILAGWDGSMIAATP